MNEKRYSIRLYLLDALDHYGHRCNWNLWWLTNLPQNEVAYHIGKATRYGQTGKKRGNWKDFHIIFGED